MQQPFCTSNICDVSVIDTQLQRKRCAATAAGHSAQRILSDFICICNDGNDSFSCSVSERQFDDSGHCASASVSMFGIGDNTAALAFGDINSVSFSVQQQPLWRRASDGSNIFGFSFQCCSSFSSSVSRSSMSATTCAAASAAWRQHQLWRATSTSTALTCSSTSALSPAAVSARSLRDSIICICTLHRQQRSLNVQQP